MHDSSSAVAAPPEVASLEVASLEVNPQQEIGTSEVVRLWTAAEDALNRGFAILTVKPRSKSPYPRYSPNAVNSATRDPQTAFAAWNDGIPANYGVGCGPSDITVCDVDHGIQNLDQLMQWMVKNGLPDTFIVQSGRDTEAGFHLYYRGAVPSTTFALDGATGELKGIGGYVVGPDSRHPSGNLYKIVNDVPLATFPAEKFSKTGASGQSVQFDGSSVTREQFEKWIEAYDEPVIYSKFDTQKNAHKYLRVTGCPWQTEHGNENHPATDFAIYVGSKGLAANCVHTSCREKWSKPEHCWQSYRTWLEQTTGKKILMQPSGKAYVGTSAQTQAPSVQSKLNLVRGDKVTAEKITWLWPGKIAAGKLTLFVGHPGIGKGLTTMDITSRVTTGKDWPDCPNSLPPSEVLIVSSEDAAGDTLKPRLMAAGADELKYFFVETTQVGDGENATEKIFSLDTDLPALRATLTEHPEVKLIVIDPVMNHLGDVNGNKEQELRRALTPLGLLAQEFDVAIILVAHFNKKVDAEVIQRVGGAMALVGCVRSAWSFSESKDDEGVRLMLSVKSNLANADGISFEIETVPVSIANELVEIARVKWGEESHEKASSALDFNTAKAGKTNNACGWLANYLIDGKQHHSGTLISIAEAFGHTKRNLQRAYKQLKGLPPAKKADGWYWQLAFTPDPMTAEPASTKPALTGTPDKETL